MSVQPAFYDCIAVFCAFISGFVTMIAASNGLETIRPWKPFAIMAALMLVLTIWILWVKP